ncbi:nucleoside hydrolase [Enterococcus hailinensis]|uniref:nucleoside hydrolase n=1 Tax=Enterococcus hailinensis TaxID=3238988 RepID=UPI0038B2C176
MKKVIFDCDNTFGLLNHDIDDGLTLLYLLGAPTIEILGVTLTFGNSDLTDVEKITQDFRQKLNLTFDYYARNQAQFLVDQVNQYPGEITLLATGALTNLAQAQTIDPAFFSKVKEIVLMGGVVKPLVVNQTLVEELNFSSDALATEKVLLSQAKLTIMNGHMTAQAFFSKNDLEIFLTKISGYLSVQSFNWFKATLESWIQWNEKQFNFKGFCNWDMTTAVYLEQPELFSAENYYLAAKQPELMVGKMRIVDTSAYLIKMPDQLTNIIEFNQLVIDRMTKGLSR